jgi:hypothetical protein
LSPGDGAAATQGRFSVPLPETGSTFQNRADKCYWLAANTTDPRIAASLRALGEEYEARAGGAG